MKKLLLPLILLVLGVGGGVGAGIFLTPPVVEQETAPGPCGEVPPVEAAEVDDAEGADHGPEAEAGVETVDAGDSTGFEYVRMNNQFVVPVVQDGAVKSLVVLTISPDNK